MRLKPLPLPQCLHKVNLVAAPGHLAIRGEHALMQVIQFGEIRIKSSAVSRVMRMGLPFRQQLLTLNSAGTVGKTFDEQGDCPLADVHDVVVGLGRGIHD